MSSLRNALPRRAHEERSQPEARKKFGLLEKHKDYVVRARAFHKKEDALRKLSEKAAFRNPEEFYFKMVNTRTVNGVHRSGIEANKYTHEELMLMNTQDIREEVKEIRSRSLQTSKVPDFKDVPSRITKKTASSYREVKGRKKRVQQLEKLYSDMALQKELQKSGRKRKLREDEMVNPTTKPAYKWCAERKR